MRNKIVALCVAAASVLVGVSCGATKRVVVFQEPPCYGSTYDSCLQAQTDLQPIAAESCEGGDRRICVVPLGQVSSGFVQDIAEHIRSEYGLTVTVLTPSSVPAKMTNSDREQIDARSLLDYMGSLFPEAYNDSKAVLIGLTPLDIYDSDSNFRFVFGYKGTAANPKGVISTFRMDPQTFGHSVDDELLFQRGEKFLSRYVGLLFYGLSPSQDPKSVLYDNVLSLDDVDRMGEQLPITPGSQNVP